MADALRRGEPVVVLESSVLAQGLPIPVNREAAERMMEAARRGGAVGAVSAVVAGVPAIGLASDELERFLAQRGVRKVSARDLGWAIARGEDGATTVAAALALCAAAGLPVLATGGIGGIHRGAPFDESADLRELASSSVIVVCAGAKSILDLPSTLERLETLGVPVIGYRTGELPGFFTRSAGLPLQMRADSAPEIAAAFSAHRWLGRRGGFLVVQPPPEEAALPAELVESAVLEALAAARDAGVSGAAVTPFLLAAVEHATGGRSLAANVALLERNVSLAAEIAAALCLQEPVPRGGAARLER